MSLQCYKCERFIKIGKRILQDGVKYVCVLPNDYEKCTYICDAPKREIELKKKKELDEQQLYRSTISKKFTCVNVNCGHYFLNKNEFGVIEIDPPIYVCPFCNYKYPDISKITFS